MGVTNSLLEQAIKNSYWNQQFTTWQRPASDSEEQRIERAARLVREVVASDPTLSVLELQITPQGSYHNNTNVRLDADMDLCARFPRHVIWSAPGLNVAAADLHLDPLPYGAVEANLMRIKDRMHEALLQRFGARNVKRGNKALTVVGVEGSRADTDIVPAAEYRLVRRGFLSTLFEERGTAIYTDDHRWIYNFPDQHHERGTAKNSRTARRYKRAVRILKRLTDDLQLSAPPPSFLVESLVYNCPDDWFTRHEDWHDTILDLIVWLYRATQSTVNAAGLFEANGIKPLFGGGQQWTVQDSHAFATAAFARVG